MPTADEQAAAELGNGAQQPDGTKARWNFSLLHLLSALLFIAAVAGLTVPAFFARADVTLTNAVRLLAKDLSSAQGRAAYLGEPVHVEFDADGLGYRVIGPAGTAIKNPQTGELFARRFDQDAVFEDVSIAGSTLSEPRRISFDGKGNVIGGGEVTLAFRGYQRSVEVDPLTGLIGVSVEATRAAPK
jgi:hypothetical protein